MMPVLSLSLFLSGCFSFVIARTNRLPGWVSFPMYFVGGSFAISAAFAMSVPKNLNTGFFLLSISFTATAVSWLLHEYFKDINGRLSKVDDRVIWGWVSYTLIMIIVVAWVVYIEPYKMMF